MPRYLGFKALSASSSMEERARLLAMGSEKVMMDAFVEQLIKVGYRRENMVATPGELRFVVTLSDIYQLDQEYPLNNSFFDTEKWTQFLRFNAGPVRWM